MAEDAEFQKKRKYVEEHHPMTKVMVFFVKTKKMKIFDNANDVLESIGGRKVMIVKTRNDAEWDALDKKRIDALYEADACDFYAATDGYRWGDGGAKEKFKEAENIEMQMLPHRLWMIYEEEQNEQKDGNPED